MSTGHSLLIESPTKLGFSSKRLAGNEWAPLNPWLSIPTPARHAPSTGSQLDARSMRSAFALGSSPAVRLISRIAMNLSTQGLDLFEPVDQEARVRISRGCTVQIRVLRAGHVGRVVGAEPGALPGGLLDRDLAADFAAGVDQRETERDHMFDHHCPIGRRSSIHAGRCPVGAVRGPSHGPIVTMPLPQSQRSPGHHPCSTCRCERRSSGLHPASRRRR